MSELSDHSIIRKRLTRLPEVQKLTGYARPVQMSNSTARSAPVAFVLGEALDWIDQRTQARESEA